MNHNHNGRACLTCSRQSVEATLARSHARWTLAGELLFLAGLGACVWLAMAT